MSTGTQTGSTSSFEYEMSQEGFSGAITSVSRPLSKLGGRSKKKGTLGLGAFLFDDYLLGRCLLRGIYCPFFLVNLCI